MIQESLSLNKKKCDLSQMRQKLDDPAYLEMAIERIALVLSADLIEQQYNHDPFDPPKPIHGH
jgi:hypothetical protein